MILVHPAFRTVITGGEDARKLNSRPTSPFDAAPA